MSDVGRQMSEVRRAPATLDLWNPTSGIWRRCVAVVHRTRLRPGVGLAFPQHQHEEDHEQLDLHGHCLGEFGCGGPSEER